MESSAPMAISSDVEQPKTGQRPPALGAIVVLYAITAALMLAAWFGPGDSPGFRAVFSRDLVSTTGTVIQVEGSSIGTSRFVTPVVEYYVNGARRTFRGVSTNLGGVSVGSRVPVSYRRNDPSVAYIRTFGQAYGLPLLMLLFASPFMLMSIIATRKRIAGRP